MGHRPACKSNMAFVAIFGDEESRKSSAEATLWLVLLIGTAIFFYGHKLFTIQRRNLDWPEIFSAANFDPVFLAPPDHHCYFSQSTTASWSLSSQFDNNHQFWAAAVCLRII